MRNRTPRVVALAGLLLLTALVSGACGGGQAGSAVPANPDLSVQAADIKFDKKAYDVTKSGPIAIAYRNTGQQVHSMVFEDSTGAEIPGFRLQVAPGKSVGGTVDLAPGTYTMICDIPGHEAAGMIAEVKVG